VEKYERNIKVKRILTTIDTNDDGVDDTIAYLNKEDLFLPILLKQSIKDLGVYTDYKEEEETIDLGSFWVTTNDGYGDFGTNPISSGATSPYGTPADGTDTVLSASTLETEGCMDPNAINYYSGATIPCAGCCDYGFSGGTSQTGGSSSNPADDVGGGCFKLNSGCYEYQSGLPSLATMTTVAINWCKADPCGGGSGYPISSTCIPNGCGGSACCPGPANTHHLLTPSECTAEGFTCDGTYSNGCNCTGGGGNIFGGIKYYDTNSSTYCSGSYKWKRHYRFYCVPD